MVFLWFSYGFPIKTPFSYGFPYLWPQKTSNPFMPRPGLAPATGGHLLHDAGNAQHPGATLNLFYKIELWNIELYIEHRTMFILNIELYND